MLLTADHIMGRGKPKPKRRDRPGLTALAGASYQRDINSMAAMPTTADQERYRPSPAQSVHDPGEHRREAAFTTTGRGDQASTAPYPLAPNSASGTAPRTS